MVEKGKSDILNLHKALKLFKDNNIVEQAKRELQVILVYPADFQRMDRMPYSHAILEAGLQEMGINPKIFSATRDRREIFKTMNDKSKFQIRGLGTFYETIYQMVGMAKHIQASDPGYRFVAMGGSGTNDKITRHALAQTEESGVDAVNRDNCQPFFDFMESIKSLPYFDKTLLKLFAHDAKLLVAGNTDVPKGKFPRLKDFPLIYSASNPERTENISLKMPHYFNCPNNCDYCCQIKFFAPHIVEDIVESIKKFPNAIAHVQFEGPTLEGKLVDSFRTILHAIEEKQGFMPKTHIVMDSKQFQSANVENTIQLLKEFNANGIHVGINAIDEDVSEAVGRRDNGKIRTEEQLQEEIQGILNFIKGDMFLEDIKLDILLTPFDTMGTIGKVVAFNKEAMKVRKDTGKGIRMYLSPLIPYPGTKVFERCKKYLKDFSYDKLKSSLMYDPTLWNEECGLFGIEFLRRFSGPLMTSNYTPLMKQDDEFRNEYLQFLALSMTYQFFQGKTTYEDMDMYDEYRNDEGAKEVFNSVMTQSTPYLPSRYK